MQYNEMRLLAMSFLRNPLGKRGKIRLVYRAEGLEGLRALATIISDISGCKVTVSKLRKIGCLRKYQRKPRVGKESATMRINRNDIIKTLEFERNGVRKGKMGGRQDLQKAQFFQ